MVDFLRSSVLRVAFWTLLSSVLAAQQPIAGDVTRVAVTAQPEQTYALYLPKSYSHGRQWPVLFAFDPLGRGELPVRQIKDLAEEYGIIVAGSNVARNGVMQRQVEAADAMIKDVTSRFTVDRRQVYLTGFSGGARLAVVVATLCNGCVTGVIAHGAGFPAQMSPTKDLKFRYFLAMGEDDFNYPEIPPLRSQLEKAGVASRIAVYAGKHQWATHDVWRLAFDWLRLQEMREGVRPKDDRVIVESLMRWSKFAQEQEAVNPYLAWLEWKQIAHDFVGLTEAGHAYERVRQLAMLPEVKDGAKRERQEIERQTKAAQEAMSLLERMQQEPSERAAVSSRAVLALSDLRKKSQETSYASRADRRALDQVTIYAFESAESAMRSRDFRLADALFAVLSDSNPDAPLPHYHRARALAAGGDSKRALQELQKSVTLGLKDVSLLKVSDLNGLRGLTEFQRLEQSLRN